MSEYDNVPKNNLSITAEMCTAQLWVHPNLRAYCAQEGVNPDDPTTLARWRMALDFFDAETWDTYSQNMMPDQASLTALLIAAPIALHAKALLDKARESDLPIQTKALLRNAVHFNRLLCAAIECNDHMPESLVTEELHSMIAGIRYPLVPLEAIETALTKTLIGIRHEFAFGQILSYTGYTFERTTEEQDSRGGDYILFLDEDAYTFIDVKLSQTHGRTGPGGIEYFLRRSGLLNVTSPVQDPEFYGAMQVSDETAMRHAQNVRIFLDHILS